VAEQAVAWHHRQRGRGRKLGRGEREIRLDGGVKAKKKVLQVGHENVTRRRDTERQCSGAKAMKQPFRVRAVKSRKTRSCQDNSFETFLRICVVKMRRIA
jgi:hypothetical protein